MRHGYLAGLVLLAAFAQAELKPLEDDLAVTSAQADISQPAVAARYQAVLLQHTAEELQAFLQRADEVAAQVDYQNPDPVALILYGDEIGLFARDRYREHKSLVDLAARLDAFNVVDLKVCEQWLAREGLTTADLPSFLQPVQDGQAEIQRLQLDGFASF